MGSNQSMVGAALALGVGGAVLLHTRRPPKPLLAGSAHREQMVVGGRRRRWLTYYPPSADLRKGPLLVALHGSGSTGRIFRRDTGFRLDSLADQYGFIVCYPDGWRRNWNESRRGGRFAAKKRHVDDTTFIRSLRELVGSPSADLWITGHSSGGQMAMRAGLEASDLVTAIAPVAASVPAAENWQSDVKDTYRRPVDVLFLLGTDDPVNPFTGGSVGLHGLGGRGTVLSADRSVEWFRTRNSRAISRRTIPQSRVELRAIEACGHHFVVPELHGPRLLGPTPGGVDMAGEVVEFFLTVASQSSY